MKMNNAVRRAYTGLLAMLAVVTLSITLTLAAGSAYAGAMMDYLESALINHVFRGTSYTAPANIYAGLSTTTCSDSSAGTEVTGGSYARVAIATGTSTWAAPSGNNGTTSNLATVTFPQSTAAWNTITSVVLYDSSSGGNGLVCITLGTPIPLPVANVTFSIPPGSLTFQIDN